MPQEIERKFLVTRDDYKKLGRGVLYRQGYLNSNANRIVRIRIVENKAMITIKGISVGAARPEFEYPIPVEDAEVLLSLCERPLLEKYRYKIDHEGMVWEIDEFLGENDGLVVAELELEAEDQPYQKPDWVGEEVTYDPRYYNSALIRHPYSEWRNG
ncbi:MAG: CYTH domain-containing protein [Clostridia bacterium]|nr:CYTH domain-containing protein [Clostridia bacterium]